MFCSTEHSWSRILKDILGFCQDISPVMSPPTVGSPGPSQPNGVVRGESGPSPDGTVNPSSDAVPLKAANFGMFNAEVRKEVESLQAGWSAVDGAITALTKVFNNHENIVKTVGDRYGQDAALEQEIRDLNLKKDGIWECIEKDRKAHQRQLLEINRKHEAQLAALQTQADAGAQEKAKYKQMEVQLANEHDKQKEGMKRELQQKQAQLEEENSAKIATLEQEKANLEAAQGRVKLELGARITDLEQKRDIREAMLTDVRRDNRALEKTLQSINVQYQMESQPSNF